MRTLIWNVTTETQTLPEVYESAEVATRWGYVVADDLATAITNLGGFTGMNNKWAIMPISPDEELGDKQVFGGGFAVAIGADGNVPWGNIVGKPTWATVAFSGQYSSLIGKPAISAVGLSGQWTDILGRPATAAPSDASPTGVSATSGSAGISADASRADHRHAHTDLPGGTLHAAASATTSGFMTASQFTKLAGISDNAAAVGSMAPLSLGAASAGVLGTAARTDHVHSHGAQTEPSDHALVTATAHGFMSSLDKSKLDGVAANAAALTSAPPVDVGAAADVGSATTAAKADHVHAHGIQAGGSLHSAATTTVAGFMSAADKLKLDGVASTAAAVGTATPTALGASADAGVSAQAARADHVHSHGAQTDSTHHAAATTTAAGFMSSADKTKLDAISRAYDLMGYYAGETPDAATDMLEVLIPRNVLIEQLIVSSDATQIPLKLVLNGADITPSAATPVAASAGAILKVVTTAATGTKAVFTVKCREA